KIANKSWLYSFISHLHGAFLPVLDAFLPVLDAFLPVLDAFLLVLDAFSLAPGGSDNNADAKTCRIDKKKEADPLLRQPHCQSYARRDLVVVRNPTNLLIL
ncbi:MAG: hypothetical protein LBS55_10055, partial [Prevotellaceae bacterium]|nr:hypothetical protein [Prevotellaceae bacterium]